MPLAHPTLKLLGFELFEVPVINEEFNFVLFKVDYDGHCAHGRRVEGLADVLRTLASGRDAEDEAAAADWAVKLAKSNAIAETMSSDRTLRLLGGGDSEA